MRSIKYLVCISMMLLGLNCHSHKTPPYPLKNMIVWDKKSMPTWKDFNGKMPWLSNHDAGTLCGAFYRDKLKKDSLEVEVFNFFSKDSSWMRQGRASKYLLNHELRHFDIFEINARQFRKYLYNWEGGLEFNFELYAQYGKKILYNDSLAHIYDSETNHSLNREEQQKWDKKIDSLLDVYKLYENTKFTLPLRPQ